MVKERDNELEQMSTETSQLKCKDKKKGGKTPEWIVQELLEVFKGCS